MKKQQKKMKQPYLWGDRDKVLVATVKERAEEVKRTLLPGFFVEYQGKRIFSKKYI